MELIRSYILEVEVNDKCYVNFVSVNMEKNALRSALYSYARILFLILVFLLCTRAQKKRKMHELLALYLV